MGCELQRELLDSLGQLWSTWKKFAWPTRKISTFSTLNGTYEVRSRTSKMEKMRESQPNAVENSFFRLLRMAENARTGQPKKAEDETEKSCSDVIVI
jgi:hypothetical protein